MDSKIAIMRSCQLASLESTNITRMQCRVWILIYVIYAVTDIELHIQSRYQAYTAYTVRSYIPLLTTTTICQFMSLSVSSVSIPSAVNISVRYPLFRYALAPFGNQLKLYLSIAKYHSTRFTARIRFEAKLLAKKNHIHAWATETHLFPQQTVFSVTCAMYGRWIASL